jgi:hypothetical protein
MKLQVKYRVIVIPNQPVITLTPLCCVLSGEATNTNFIIFGLTRPGIEPTIYRIRDEHATHYTTNAVYFELRRLDNKTMINIEMCNKCLCDNDPQAYRTVRFGIHNCRGENVSPSLWKNISCLFRTETFPI